MTKKQRVTKMPNDQKYLIRLLIGKLPKEALRGKDLTKELNYGKMFKGTLAEWQRAFVAYQICELIYKKIANQAKVLADQLDDTFNSNIDKGVPMELNELTISNIKLLYRIRNIYAVNSRFLLDMIDKLSKLMPPLETPTLTIKERETLLDYVGEKAIRLEALNEMAKYPKIIDDSIATCFASSIENGTDLEKYATDALIGINTKQDLDAIALRFLTATGLQRLMVG